ANRTAAAEDRRSTQHGGRDGGQFIAGPSVRLRLPEMSDIDHGSQASGETRKRVNQRKPRIHGNPGVARAVIGGAQRPQASAYTSRFKKQPINDRRQEQDQELRWKEADPVALS